MSYTAHPPVPTDLGPAVPSPLRAGEMTASGESPYVTPQAVKRGSLWMRALDLVRGGPLAPLLAALHFTR